MHPIEMGEAIMTMETMSIIAMLLLHTSKKFIILRVKVQLSNLFFSTIICFLGPMKMMKGV